MQCFELRGISSKRGGPFQGPSLNLFFVNLLCARENHDLVVMDYTTVFGIVKYADLHVVRFNKFSAFNQIHVSTLIPYKDAETRPGVYPIVSKAIKRERDDDHIVIKETGHQPFLNIITDVPKITAACKREGNWGR
jgi:hypothetical protein